MLDKEERVVLTNRLTTIEIILHHLVKDHPEKDRKTKAILDSIEALSESEETRQMIRVRIRQVLSGQF